MATCRCFVTWRRTRIFCGRKQRRFVTCAFKVNDNVYTDAHAVLHAENALICFTCAAPSYTTYATIDIFNGITGKWSTAALSVARIYLAGTSLPNENLVLFAGGAGVFL